jgi:iron complex transport system permease protein
MPRPADPAEAPPFGRNRRLSPWRLGLVLALALALLFFISLASGYLPFTAPEIWQITKAKLFGSTAGLDESRVLILWDLRLPRLFTALLTGAALSLSGAIFQGLLLNPLADPYTLGVSSGAALGASLVIAAGLIFPDQALLFEPWALTAGAFLAAALTLAAVTALASDGRGHLSPTSLILAGVILSAILSAAISFIKYLAGEQVASIVFWLLGSFQARVWADAGLVLVFFIPALAVALWSAVDLNIMTLGAASAETLGVGARRARLKLLAAAALAASAAVSVAGIIGFVGLIVPHLIRLLAGPDHRALLPLSALGGAALLLAADTVVRAVLPGEIPVGVLTALLAGPAFLVIFRRRLGRLTGD